MKHRCITWLSVVLLAFVQRGFCQNFVNMDFERALPRVPFTLPNEPGDFVDPSLAFHDWTVGGAGTVSFYNAVSIGAPAVTLIGPLFPNFLGVTPLQGSYSVLLQYYGSASSGAPTLSQTAVVPAFAKSISFLADPDSRAVVTLDGVGIPLVTIAGGRLAGDVSVFSGRVAQLTFSTPASSDFRGVYLYFDDIQFSPGAVPEPSILGLVALGIISLVSTRKKAA